MELGRNFWMLQQYIPIMMCSEWQLGSEKYHFNSANQYILKNKYTDIALKT